MLFPQSSHRHLKIGYVRPRCRCQSQRCSLPIQFKGFTNACTNTYKHTDYEDRCLLMWCRVVWQKCADVSDETAAPTIYSDDGDSKYLCQYRYTCTRLHGVTSLKKIIFTLALRLPPRLIWIISSARLFSRRKVVWNRRFGTKYRSHLQRWSCPRILVIHKRPFQTTLCRVTTQKTEESNNIHCYQRNKLNCHTAVYRRHFVPYN